MIGEQQVQVNRSSLLPPRHCRAHVPPVCHPFSRLHVFQVLGPQSLFYGVHVSPATAARHIMTSVSSCNLSSVMSAMEPDAGGTFHVLLDELFDDSAGGLRRCDSSISGVPVQHRVVLVVDNLSNAQAGLRVDV